MKPKIFIGSSGKSISIARNISEHLSDIGECTIWDEGVFGLGEGTLESILNIKADFAILVIAPDDVLIKKGKETLAPRDNVVFEAGFFIGKIGKSRTFLVYDYKKKMDLPSDLAGITLATFDGEREDNNELAAVGIACNKIRRSISKQGLIQSPYLNESKLSRGSLKFSELMIDGALVIQDGNTILDSELKKRIFSDEIIPMKFLYCTNSASEYWLKICTLPEYTFYTNSEILLKKVAKEIVSEISKNCGTLELDIISLGTGNGVKDKIILRDILENLLPNEIVYYYPVEISYAMLSKSLNHLLSNVSKNNLKIKSILGDFNLIDKYEPIYQERINPNLMICLGNSIGNSDEKELLKSINNSLYPGDFFLVEVNTSLNSLEAFTDDEINKLHDFSPLHSLGVPYEKDKLKYETVSNISTIKNTKSVMAIYESAKIGKKMVEDIKLSIVHHYEINSFKDYLSSEMGLTILSTWTSKNVAIFLSKKE